MLNPSNKDFVIFFKVFILLFEMVFQKKILKTRKYFWIFKTYIQRMHSKKTKSTFYVVFFCVFYCLKTLIGRS